MFNYVEIKSGDDSWVRAIDRQTDRQPNRMSFTYDSSSSFILLIHRQIATLIDSQCSDISDIVYDYFGIALELGSSDRPSDRRRPFFLTKPPINGMVNSKQTAGRGEGGGRKIYELCAAHKIIFFDDECLQ